MLSRGKKQSVSINPRLWWVSGVVLGSAVIILLRFFFLQVLAHEEYLDLARRQQEYTETLEPQRGTIYFQEDKSKSFFTAATIQQGYLLYINNREFDIAKTEEVFEGINNITPIDRSFFDAILNKKDDPYEVLKNKVSLEEGDRILDLRYSGVGLVSRSWRFYPGNSLASHVIGFVSHASENPQGQYGIEKYFESDLRGAGGHLSAEYDAKGILFALGQQFKTLPREGQDIILSIDPIVQRATEEELFEIKELWKPQRGGIIIVEPQTGRIKALAALPSFNPNEYFKEKDFSVFLNPFVEKIFELGSVFKPLTMAAALDHGVLRPETTYTDNGHVRVGAAVIKNFDGKAHGIRTMTQVLEESLNTGSVFVMQKLGAENLEIYFKKYGLSEKLGIDLPGEVAGNLNNLKSGREVEFATASFGQGIAVTPLELTMALSSLGNGGKLMQPFVVSSVGQNTPREPILVRQVLKPETSRTITRMLIDVVDHTLAGGKAKKPGYSIAAKTGTAQIPKKDGRGYEEDTFLHSFFGYFPAYEPRFLIFLFIERPIGVRYASQSLTDSFRTLTDFLINYYTIAPDRPNELSSGGQAP